MPTKDNKALSVHLASNLAGFAFLRPPSDSSWPSWPDSLLTLGKTLGSFDLNIYYFNKPEAPYTTPLSHTKLDGTMKGLVQGAPAHL